MKRKYKKNIKPKTWRKCHFFAFGDLPMVSLVASSCVVWKRDWVAWAIYSSDLHTTNLHLVALNDPVHLNENQILWQWSSRTISKKNVQILQVNFFPSSLASGAPVGCVTKVVCLMVHDDH